VLYSSYSSARNENKELKETVKCLTSFCRANQVDIPAEEDPSYEYLEECWDQVMIAYHYIMNEIEELEETIDRLKSLCH